MNKNRMKQLTKVLGTIRDAIEANTSELESIRDEEQDYYDNMPESFQNGEKGERTQNFVDNLETLLSFLEEAISAIDELESL